MRDNLRPIHVTTTTRTVWGGYEFVDVVSRHKLARWAAKHAFHYLTKWGFLTPFWRTEEVYRFDPPDLGKAPKANMEALIKHITMLRRVHGDRFRDKQWVLVLGPYAYADLIHDKRAIAAILGEANGLLDLRWQHLGDFRFSQGGACGIDVMVVNHVDGWAFLPKWVEYVPNPRRDE